MKEVMKEKALYVCLLPLDFNFIIAPFVAKINPKMAVVVETELAEPDRQAARPPCAYGDDKRKDIG